MADLQKLSIAELQAEIKKRQEPKPLFEQDGKRYFDTKGYEKYLEYIDETGLPKDFTPVEFYKNGTAKSIEPTDVCINLEAFISNRVYVDADGAYHVVYDTRTIRESETGEITIANIPEVVLTKQGKGNDYKVTRSSVTRNFFMEHYVQALNVDDMLTVLRTIDQNSADLNGEVATIKLG